MQDFISETLMYNPLSYLTLRMKSLAHEDVTLCQGLAGRL